jgi:hypothetical protein
LKITVNQSFKMLFLVFSFIVIIQNNLFAQIKLSEGKWVFPTFEVLPPDKNLMLFNGVSYSRSSKIIYPYELNNMISKFLLLIGLGYKGLGETGKAKENLKQSVDLSVSNLWAGV